MNKKLQLIINRYIELSTHQKLILFNQSALVRGLYSSLLLDYYTIALE